MDLAPPRPGLFRRIAGTLSFVALVAISLLTFPSHLPLMLGGWLLCHAVLVARARPAWLPLLIGPVVLLVKGTPWFASIIVLVLAWVAVASGHAPWSSLWRRRRMATAGVAVCLAAWIAFAVQWRAASQSSANTVFQAGRPVVCVGDSLTSGMNSNDGYPLVLGKRLSVPVINLGLEGITTVRGVEMIPAIQAARPQAVVIELGGHDFLKGKPRAEVKQNLQKLILAARAVGAEPVLMEIPRGFIFDPFRGVERELAWEHDLQLIPDTVIRRAVIWSPVAPPGMWTDGPYLSDDGLHPNHLGNQEMADEVVATLVKLLGPEVVINRAFWREGG